MNSAGLPHSDSQRFRELGEFLRSRSSLNVVCKPSRTMVVGQFQLAHYPHDATVPQSHFVYSVEFVLVATGSQIIDQEHA